MSDERPKQWGTSLPQRTKRVKRKNKRRGGHRFPKTVDESYRRWIRERPCLLRLAVNKQLGVFECYGEVEPDHVKTRGTGGPDRRNMVPLCQTHHRLRHDMGRRSFEKWYEVDLAAKALDFDEWYTERVEEAW